MAAAVAKSILLAAVVIAMASATTYSTVVDGEEINSNLSCQEEIDPGMMSDCMMWMREKIVGKGRYEEGAEEMREQCCNGVKELKSECVGLAVKQMMNVMQHQYGMVERTEEIRHVAESLPSTCGLQPPSHCPVRRTTVFI